MTSIVIRTFIIYCAVSLCVRLMGKRQLGQLQPGELVVTILISEIAASPITDTDEPLVSTLVPLFLLVAFEIFSSLISRKSVGFRYVSDGRPINIIKNGKVQQKNLKKLRLTIDDILAALRQKDIFDIDEVEYAVVETNGTLSVLQKRIHQPLTCNIINTPIEDSDVPVPIVIDGKILNIKDGIISVKKYEIEKFLSEKNIRRKDVLLMTSDKNKKFTVILKEDI